MNEIALGKENLKKALLEVSKNYLENLELAPAQEVHYSLKLEQKMEKLLTGKEWLSSFRIATGKDCIKTSICRYGDSGLMNPPPVLLPPNWKNSRKKSGSVPTIKGILLLPSLPEKMWLFWDWEVPLSGIVV